MSNPEADPDPLECYTASAQETLDVSEPIQISSFMSKWGSLLSQDELQLADCPSLTMKSIPDAQTLLPNEILDELYLLTNPVDTLYPADVVPFQIPKLSDVPSHVKLHSAQYTATHKSKQSSQSYRHTSLLANKFREKDDSHLLHNFATSRISRGKASQNQINHLLGLASGPRRVISPEAMLTITVQRPKKVYTNKREQIKRGATYFSFHAISSNTLADLRDVIKCPKDFEVPGDFSFHPDAISTTRKAADIFPSSMFFIEDVFYIDTRHVKAQDYSKPILKWLRKRGCSKNLPTLSMADHPLSTLTIKLGQPYLFVHQGDCEHVMQFRDLRLVCETDCQFSEAYPLMINKHQVKSAICNVCQSRSVEWMVRNSSLSPTDPSHYCDVCFKMLHYLKDGTKVCDFEAYRYTDNDFIGSL